jgi:hypothetical protein
LYQSIPINNQAVLESTACRVNGWLRLLSQPAHC